jgi:hypothetical protein
MIKEIVDHVQAKLALRFLELIAYTLVGGQ